MAESVFNKPIDTAIQEINDKIGTVLSGETVEGQIDALNSKLTPKTTTISGTTQSNGSLALGLRNSENTVVMVKESTATYRATPVAVGTYWYCIITTDTATPTAVTNQSVSVIVKYFEF